MQKGAEQEHRSTWGAVGPPLLLYEARQSWLRKGWSTKLGCSPPTHRAKQSPLLKGMKHSWAGYHQSRGFTHTCISHPHNTCAHSRSLALSHSLAYTITHPPPPPHAHPCTHTHTQSLTHPHTHTLHHLHTHMHIQCTLSITCMSSVTFSAKGQHTSSAGNEYECAIKAKIRVLVSSRAGMVYCKACAVVKVVNLCFTGRSTGQAAGTAGAGGSQNPVIWD